MIRKNCQKCFQEMRKKSKTYHHDPIQALDKPPTVSGIYRPIRNPFGMLPRTGGQLVPGPKLD